MVEVTDAALQQAAGEGMDAFVQVFTDAYKRVIGGELTAAVSYTHLTLPTKA